MIDRDKQGSFDVIKSLTVLIPAILASHSAFASVVAVPEPASLSILAIGAGVAAVLRRRK